MEGGAGEAKWINKELLIPEIWADVGLRAEKGSQLWFVLTLLTLFNPKYGQLNDQTTRVHSQRNIGIHVYVRGLNLAIDMLRTPHGKFPDSFQFFNIFGIFKKGFISFLSVQSLHRRLNTQRKCAFLKEKHLVISTSLVIFVPFLPKMYLTKICFF